MNEDDRKLAAWIALCCIVGSLALILAVLIVSPARAAAVLTLDGRQIVVMTADELLRVLAEKDAAIAALQSRLDERKRVDCPVI